MYYVCSICSQRSVQSLRLIESVIAKDATGVASAVWKRQDGDQVTCDCHEECQYYGKTLPILLRTSLANLDICINMIVFPTQASTSLASVWPGSDPAGGVGRAEAPSSMQGKV